MDCARVSGGRRIDPVVVNIAIENLGPTAAAWKTDLIVVPVLFVQTRYNHDIISGVFHPALKRQDTILIVEVESVAAFSTQTGLVLAKAD